MHCHHEKTIVVDDRVAFVGGIDLTSESGDRFDTCDHAARGQAGWQDSSGYPVRRCVLVACSARSRDLLWTAR